MHIRRRAALLLKAQIAARRDAGPFRPAEHRQRHGKRPLVADVLPHNRIAPLIAEHVARRNPAPLRHAHPLDGHALVGSQRQLHILRLREREIAAELDFLLQLALLGSHQLDLGG